MVSIMRPEQTLRLIQLYHANYPEIARNNQDADGRNLKLQMWAQITEELNQAWDTKFTVEQFKKKVQNVQCTSRQKLYSGKRNLGEAEVEYLRLFESDKISGEVLAQRAKNRHNKSYSSSPHPMDHLAINRRWENGQEAGGIGKEKDNGICSSTEESAQNSSCRNSAESSIFGGQEETVGNIERHGNGSVPLSRSTTGTAPSVDDGCQPLDNAAEQFLLAMLNVTLGGIGTAGTMENNNGTMTTRMAADGTRKRAIGSLNDNQTTTITPATRPSLKRSRKADKPTRTMSTIGNEQIQMKAEVEEEKEKDEGMATATAAEDAKINGNGIDKLANKLEEQLNPKEKEKPKNDNNQQMLEERQLQPSQSANQKRTTITTSAAILPLASSAFSPIPSSSSSSSVFPVVPLKVSKNSTLLRRPPSLPQPLHPPNSLTNMMPSDAPNATPGAIGCCCHCQCHQKPVQKDAEKGSCKSAMPISNPIPTFDQLYARLDTTNATLARIAELIAERLPVPVTQHNGH